MEIVQLSDLHIGAQFREEVFGNVIDEINSLKPRSEEHTSELQSLVNLVCRLLLEKKKKKKTQHIHTTIRLKLFNFT